jgi:hypothetical protein
VCGTSNFDELPYSRELSSHTLSSHNLVSFIFDAKPLGLRVVGSASLSLSYEALVLLVTLVDLDEGSTGAALPGQVGALALPFVVSEGLQSFAEKRRLGVTLMGSASLSLSYEIFVRFIDLLLVVCNTLCFGELTSLRSHSTSHTSATGEFSLSSPSPSHTINRCDEDIDLEPFGLCVVGSASLSLSYEALVLLMTLVNLDEGSTGAALKTVIGLSTATSA